MACLLTYPNNKVATELAAQKLAENWKARNPDECCEDNGSPMLENLDDSLTSLNWLQNMNINLEQSSEKSNISSESSTLDQAKSGDISSNDGDLNEEENKPQEIDYRTDTNHKPPYSYATLICMAMKESKKSKITLSAIYNWIKENFMYYRIADPSWQNSIRHNLSLNKCFAKVPRKKDEPGKGGFWKIDPAHADMFVDGIFRKRRSCKENKDCNQIKKKIRALSNDNYCEAEVVPKDQTLVLNASDNSFEESTSDFDQSVVGTGMNKKKKQQQLLCKSDSKKDKNYRYYRQQCRNGKGVSDRDLNKSTVSDHQKKKKTDSIHSKNRKTVNDIKHKKKLSSKRIRRSDQRVPESKLREESDETTLDNILERNFDWDTFFYQDTALSCNSQSPSRSSHESVDPSLFNISNMSDFQLSPPISHINCCDDEFTTEDYIPEILPTDDPDVELMVRGFSCFPSSPDTFNDPLLDTNNSQGWQEQKSTQVSISELLADPWSENKDGSDLFQSGGDMRSVNSVVLL